MAHFEKLSPNLTYIFQVHRSQSVSIVPNLIRELCHDILSHLCEVQNQIQIEGSLKIIVY